MLLLRAFPFVLILVVSACKVAETPESYIDPAAGLQEDRDLAAGEIRDRVLAMAQAIGRGNVDDAISALAPARDAYVLGLRIEGSGSLPLRMVLDSVISDAGGLRTQEVVVSVAPRANVAWFRTLLQSPNDTVSTEFHLTGVYLLDQGSWRLVQAHLSPISPPPLPESNPPAPGEAPEEDG